jgi:nucleotide-binding universal stress UspA family protein
MRLALVALDDSPRAPQVLDYAVSLARLAGLELRLLRVVGVPAPLPPEAYAVPIDRITQFLDEEARRDMELLAERIPPGITFRTEVQHGTAWDVICRTARADNVDLIVIGSHGYSVIDRILGTTAARIVNHADRPVLVFRPVPSS